MNDPRIKEIGAESLGGTAAPEQNPELVWEHASLESHVEWKRWKKGRKEKLKLLGRNFAQQGSCVIKL